MCYFGKLPSGDQILSFLTSRIQTDLGHKDSVLHETTPELMLHWIYCNGYTQSYTTVRKKISDLHDEYVFLRNYPVKKRKETLEKA